MDLISRQAVNEVLYDLGLGDEENGGDPEYMSALHDCKEFIDQIPSAENKGEWIIDDAKYGRIWECHCSKCGEDPQKDISGTENWWLDKLPNFCPNCGADMRKTETCNGCTHPCVMYEPMMKACEEKGREI